MAIIMLIKNEIIDVFFFCDLVFICILNAVHCICADPFIFRDLIFPRAFRTHSQSSFTSLILVVSFPFFLSFTRFFPSPFFLPCTDQVLVLLPSLTAGRLLFCSNLHSLFQVFIRFCFPLHIYFCTRSFFTLLFIPVFFYFL